MIDRPEPRDDPVAKTEVAEDGPDHREFTKVHRRRRLVLRFPLCGAAPLLTVLLLGATAGLSSQDAPANKESDFLSARPPADGRGPARRRRATGRLTASVSSFRASANRAIPSTRSTRSTSRRASTKRVSPGYGKTTCSFFRPGSGRDSVRVHASRSHVEAAAAGGARLPRVGQDSAATRGTTTRSSRSTAIRRAATSIGRRRRTRG